MWNTIQKWYWEYVFHMEVERSLQLDRVYEQEKVRISQMKYLALRKLNDLNTHEATT